MVLSVEFVNTNQTQTENMKENPQSQNGSSSSKFKDLFKTRDSGWAGMKSTSLFRAVNIELYARPNKYVMTFGAITFATCISYIVYMNWTDDKKRTTYVTLDEDGGTTTRPRVSKWY